MREIYTIYDVVAMESGPLFEAKNDAVALRQYQTIVQKNGIDPRDFQLRHVGTLDSERSRIFAEDEFQIVNGLDISPVEEDV